MRSMLHQVDSFGEKGTKFDPPALLGIPYQSPLSISPVYSLYVGLLGLSLLPDFQDATQALFFLPLTSLCEMAPPQLLSKSPNRR
jgi:hypothetical protein